MKKSHFNLFFFLFPVIILIFITTLLFFGVVWFNNPDKNQYPVRGIDISNHQGFIDWRKVKEDNVDFVFIKATEGGDFKDKSFQYNLAESLKNNIYTGAYHFFTLCKPGKEQANNFISIVPIKKAMLPPAIDLEFTGNCSSRPKQYDFKKEIIEFFNIIKKHYNKTPIIYTTYEFEEKYNLASLFKSLWIRDIFFKPKSRYKWTIWQYTNRKHIKGIKGFVDGNVFYGSREEFGNLLNE